MDYGPELDTYKDKTVGYYGGKFFPFHLGHLSYIMKAQSMVDVLFVVVYHDPEHEKELCADTPYEWVPASVRERWITETFKGFPNIRVTSHYEPRTDDYMNDDRLFDTNNALVEKLGGRIDVTFSNTHEYDAYFERYLPDSEHVVFYEDRDIFDISATKIREQNVYKAWEYLPKSVQTYYTKRVAICGIESSGKTHISRMLAQTFQTENIEEYGRIYYDDIGGWQDIAVPEDYIRIATGHCYLLNEGVKKAHKVLIADTDLIYTQYFYMMNYGHKNEVIDALIKSNIEQIDEYVYIEPHNVHELDGTRRPLEDEARTKNNDALKALYKDYGKTLRIIDEKKRDARFHESMEVINKLI